VKTLSPLLWTLIILSAVYSIYAIAVTAHILMAGQGDPAPYGYYLILAAIGWALAAIVLFLHRRAR
jgi:hypothetical protein